MVGYQPKTKRMNLNIGGGGYRPFHDHMEKWKRARTVKQLWSNSRATAPATTAEQEWAGYRLRIRQLTKKERAERRELRWMLGYWGANGSSLPGYSKAWSPWLQVHVDTSRYQP